MSESSNRLKIVGIALCVLSTTALLMVPGRAPADSRPPLSGEFARQIKLIEDRPEFPDLPFKELLPDGKLGERRLSQFRGRVLVVTFWATWCGICAREMPTLDKLQESLGGEDILVVALAQDDRSSADVRAYLKKRNLANLRVFHDREGTLAAVLGI
ncbi:MAG: TlpA family protein disulfide reductase, partial [bacterium]|nr:TlpA family protein disulfide reductase [bacterium]